MRMIVMDYIKLSPYVVGGLAIQSVLRPEELEAVLAAEHRPNFIISMMSEIVSLAGLDAVQVQCSYLHVLYLHILNLHT
jgi:hypothetical protein